MWSDSEVGVIEVVRLFIVILYYRRKGERKFCFVFIEFERGERRFVVEGWMW